MISKSQVRADIRKQPCGKCGESIEEDVDSVLTFGGGRFIQLHVECADFIRHATKGLRAALAVAKEREAATRGAGG